MCIRDRSCETLCPGVFLVSTASHGGTMVANEVAAVLSPAAKKCGFFTIDKSRIERFMGYASKAEMLRIDMALLVSLALNVLSGKHSQAYSLPMVDQQEASSASAGSSERKFPPNKRTVASY